MFIPLILSICRCECHGHSSSCHQTSGVCESCQNNTESDCKSDQETEEACWQKQVSINNVCVTVNMDSRVVTTGCFQLATTGKYRNFYFTNVQLS